MKIYIPCQLLSYRVLPSVFLSAMVLAIGLSTVAFGQKPAAQKPSSFTIRSSRAAQDTYQRVGRFHLIASSKRNQKLIDVVAYERGYQSVPARVIMCKTAYPAPKLLNNKKWWIFENAIIRSYDDNGVETNRRRSNRYLVAVD